MISVLLSAKDVNLADDSTYKHIDLTRDQAEKLIKCSDDKKLRCLALLKKINIHEIFSKHWKFVTVVLDQKIYEFRVV